MSLRENTCYSCLLLLIFVSGCTAIQQNTNSEDTEESPVVPLTLQIQAPPPPEIQSVQLHPKGDPGQAPILQIDSGEQLRLSFDYLSEQSHQFRVEISHRTKDWKESPVPTSSFMEGFYQAHIQRMQESFSQQPTYQHLEFDFPNDQLRPTVSGNYLLEVYSYQSDTLLFSMPFFITEDEGELQTDIEPLYAQREDDRPLHQLSTRYHYPPFVEYPQFDLSVSYVQNKYWGRTREADFIDTATPGEIYAQQARDQAFVGDLSFKLLDIRSFDPDGSHILEYQPEHTPPKIILQRDIQYLDSNPRLFADQHLGRALDEQSSNYALVQFSLETEDFPASTDIYVVGHFNNWMIDPLNKMKYDTDHSIWKGEAFVKQGEYAYKYIKVQSNGIDDIALDQSFRSAEQEYLTLVYFKDTRLNLDRLLYADQVLYK